MKSMLCLAAASITLWAVGSENIKSGYVTVLKQGEVFAPVDDVSGASVMPVADTDEVFPAGFVEDFDVDGDMSKPQWQKARPIPALFDRRKKAHTVNKSDIRLLYSKTAIYIGATLWQDMSKMVCKWDQRDMPIWNDDNIEIFLNIPSEKGNRLYQYVLNPINSLADICDGNRGYWTRGNKHATKRFKDRWMVEIKLPFAGIPMDRPVAGDFIGIRICRTVHEPKSDIGSSPALLTPGNGQRARFAKLLFETPMSSNAAKFIAEGEAYRKEALRKRFYERYKADKSRFREVCASIVSFSGSKHPLHEEARQGVRQMQKALDAFEGRFAAELAAGKAIPESESRKMLSMFSGFWAYASKYAYVVWLGNPWERGAPDDMPPESARLLPRSVAFEQAGNEREAVCINVSGILCGSRLDVRIHPHNVERTKTSPFVSSDNFEVYSEPFVRFGGELITAPHIRAPGNMITVTPGRTTRVWVMFNSRDVRPGNYSTRLSFKPAYDLSVADRDVPMEVKVWNFALPETRNWPIKGFFWGPYSFAEDEVALLELTHDYHVTHGWTQHLRYQYGLRDDTGWYRKPDKGKGVKNPDHDFEDDLALHANEPFFRKAKELGMRFVIGWGTPVSLDWFKVMTKRFLDMGFEYEDFTYKGLLLDEFAKKDIPPHAARREAVWNWNTNLHFQATYLSTPPPTGATMDDIEAGKLPEFYRQWTVIHSRCKDPKEGPDTIGRLRKKGCKVWTYKCQQFMQGLSVLKYYRFYPWEAYMMDLEGFAFWTSYSPKGDGWDSRDGYDEGLCWRGVDKKPIPTKILEAVREGLEDVAYMDLLKRSGSAAAKQLLDARDDVIGANSQKVLDAWRLAAGRLIDELSRSRR